MTTPKRIHVRPVQRKCGTCGSKQQTYSVGEYIRSKWHNVRDVCDNYDCIAKLRADVSLYVSRTGRAVELVGDVPDFLKEQVS